MNNRREYSSSRQTKIQLRSNYERSVYSGSGIDRPLTNIIMHSYKIISPTCVIQTSRNGTLVSKTTTYVNGAYACQLLMHSVDHCAIQPGVSEINFVFFFSFFFGGEGVFVSMFECVMWVCLAARARACVHVCVFVYVNACE